MAMFYFNGGFYAEVQEDAVEISDEAYLALIEGQADGRQIVAGADGLPTLAAPPPTPFHRWDGTAWALDESQKQAVISAEKSAKLAEINQKAQAFVNELAKYDETPAFERDTWLEQAKEARAWFADKSAPTPTLDLIAQMRGVPQDLLRQKAYEKALAYQQVAAIVAGQRQAYEDKLNAAETLEQVQAIKAVYQLLSQGADR